MCSISTYKEIKDIVIGKLVDHTITDDYEDLSEKLFGEGNCYSSTETRKRMYGMKHLIEVIESESEASILDSDVISELDRKKFELEIERQRLSDQRSAFNKAIKERGRQEELNNIILNSINAGDIPQLKYKAKKIHYGDNDLLVSLNDIHYGLSVSNNWNEYNSDICKEMFRHYLDNIISIANQHGSENCIVWANGDLISGVIKYSISVQNNENVIEQVMGVSELISQFLSELSNHFSRVTFASVSGNHSRITQKKEDCLKEERLDNLVRWYLAARLQNFPNIEIISNSSDSLLDETMYIINIRGKNYCGVHGDYDKLTDYSKTKASINNLQTLSPVHLYAILTGHLHHNKIDTVQGVKVIMGGSFVGMDDYCVQKRIFGKPEQLVCVCDSNGVRCLYDIDLSSCNRGGV